MAIWRRGRPRELLHHSDRGSQYTSEAFQRLMAEHWVTCSLSRYGNVWDPFHADEGVHGGAKRREVLRFKRNGFVVWEQPRAVDAVDFNLKDRDAVLAKVEDPVGAQIVVGVIPVRNVAVEDLVAGAKEFDVVRLPRLRSSV